ncbi:ferredoxin [Candidatus Woesearchaeota archaeon]|nr:ferredoxin [Candidatus Woesearchaeota archaeon]
MAKYHIEVDPNLCTGCGVCPAVCADHFEMYDDPNGMPKAKCTHPDIDSVSCQKEAADSCPNGAIKVTENAG